MTIAKDVKLQVEFNPAVVEAYRLIGYENRALEAQDFADDRKDAGEIGAGHTVTALYELVPAGSGEIAATVDPLRYQGERAAGPESSEAMFVRIRYKAPDGAQSRLVEVPVDARARALAQTSDDYRFSAAVAAFGMLLRGSEHRGTVDFPGVARLAGTAIGPDRDGIRHEFLQLVKRAERLSRRG